MALDFRPTLDVAAARRQITTFLAEYASLARARGAVVGLSGGIDSALVAALAAEALGPQRVLGLLLPHRDSDPGDERDGRLLADAIGVAVERVDVTPLVEAAAAACAHEPEIRRLAYGNLKARSRMMILYAHANATGRLVLGTGNKSELLTGYFTKFGDGAADVYPIGDLYKTQVRALAEDLGVPRAILEKAPSAGLHPGQTDEAELGVPYALLDQILSAFEGGHDAETVARLVRAPPEAVLSIERRILESEHKRTPLVVPKLGFRTPGLDWRLPRSRANAARRGEGGW